jgi:phosphatidylinositol alpha-mannosyltransferase
MKRPAIGRVIRILLSVAIIVLLVMFARTVNWTRAWNAIVSASPWLLLAAVAANLLSLVFRAIRWWVLLRAVGQVSLLRALAATVAGAGLNNVLVAQGGEAARVVFITRASGIPSSRVIATAALDRLFDPIGFIALLGVGALAFDLPPDLARFRTPAIVILVLVAILLVWLALTARTATPEHVPERRAVPRGWKGKLRRWLVEFGGSMRELATGPRIVAVVLLTLAAWVAQLVTFALAASAAHVYMPLPGHLAALLATNVSLIIRATPGNVGFFQFAYALVASEFGVRKADAIAVSVLIQALQIIPVTILGVAIAPDFIFRRHKGEAPEPVV